MLEAPLTALFRLQNVSTKRRDRISSDEEERMRQGFELRTAFRFQDTQTGTRQRNRPNDAGWETDRQPDLCRTRPRSAHQYGLAPRADPNQHGFVLDIERGYWEKRKRLR